MCTTWAQGVSGHHQSFLRKRWIGPRADKGEKKKKNPAITTTYVHIYIMLGSFLCGFIYGWIIPGRGK
jgi:hypothetical protein